MNINKITSLVGIESEALTRALSQMKDEEDQISILELVLTGHRTPSGDTWTTERLTTLAEWQAEAELPPRLAEAVKIVNEFLDGGRYEVAIQDENIAVTLKPPVFMTPIRRPRRGRRRSPNGEVTITVTSQDGTETPVGSFSELVRSLGGTPRHEHGLKTAAPLARQKGVRVIIGGRPSETVLKIAAANRDVIDIADM